MSKQIEIRVTGPSGSGKPIVAAEVAAFFSRSGCVPGSIVEGSDYVSFSVSPVGMDTVAEHVSGGPVIELPETFAGILSPTLSDQGYTVKTRRHPLIDSFIEAVKGDVVLDTTNDGTTFGAQRTQAMFEGFCFGKEVA